MKVIILVDHLRIGGRERLALDQMYEMADHEIECVLISLDPKSTQNNPNFLRQDSELYNLARISILDGPQGKLKQFLFLWRTFRNFKPDVVLSHTLPAVVIARLIRPFTRIRYRINTVIHQLPSLSDTRQRLKRMLYAQFADFIFAYSIAVEREWNLFVTSSKFQTLLFSKRIYVLRNGIYLKRLPVKERKDHNHSQDSLSPRLIFVGRLVSWKGLDKFEDIYFSLKSLMPNLLVITPSDDQNVRKILNKIFENRVEFLVGGTLAEYSPKPKDIHIYPVDYGPNATHIESVSLNCLEMAALGIKSMVSINGCETWPELLELGVLIETDWTKRNSISTSFLRANSDSLTKSDISKIRALVNIRENISGHLGTELGDPPHTH